MRLSLRAAVLGLIVAAMLAPTGSALVVASPSAAQHGSPAVAPSEAGNSVGPSALAAARPQTPENTAASLPQDDLTCSNPSGGPSGLAWSSSSGSGPVVAGVPGGGGNLSTPAVAPAQAGVVRQVVADGACPSLIFPPRAAATPAEVSHAQASGVVTPLYQGIPAPLGLADFGLRISNGTLVGSVLNTTSVRGQVDANSSGIEPIDAYNSALGAGAYTIQLNAVLTNVTLFGTPGYQFWTQNVFEYYTGAQHMLLITNVWNFSGDPLIGAAIYGHGANGSIYGDEVYEAAVSFYHVTYPFNLSLYLNSSLVGGRDAVYFTGVLSGPGEAVDAPFDYVIFNSIGTHGPSPTAPAEFSANGTGYNPIGLPDDFELDFGGPGDGSQVDLLSANADLGLAYWNPAAAGGSGGYTSIPSAYSYGSETGETALGGTVTWSDSPGGPSGVSTYATMRTGPAFLAGLWNVSGPEGSFPITLHSSPTNAFEVVTPQVQTAWTELAPTGTGLPGERSAYQEAYDPALNATILFGGYSPLKSAPLGDTWEYANGIWTNISAPGGPSPRFSGGMVYDPADHYLVLFGGKTLANQAITSPSQFAGDTWEFNATGWHQLHPSHAPSRRGFFAMAYDAADSEVLLYGGGIGTHLSPWVLYTDTWTFHAGQWTNITATAGTPPPARINAQSAYDAADGYVLLVGGENTTMFSVACPYLFPDEWTFSGGHWSALTPTGAVPPAGDGALWFDSATGTTYYYEGVENTSYPGTGCESFGGNVYAYSHGNWAQLGGVVGAGAPTARIDATMIDDPAAGIEFLLDGQQGIDGPFFNQSWAFNPSAVVNLSAQPYIVPEAAVGPTITTGTFWLAPGNYSLLTELSGYAPTTTQLSVTGPLTVNVTLAPEPALGIYTPLWAWSDAGLAAISTAGNGTPSNPYVLDQSQPDPIGPDFGLYNDYDFPVYPGLFLLDTTASVEISPPPDFLLTATNTLTSPGDVLSPLNVPALWFWNVSGVALVHGSDIGAGEEIVSGAAPFALMFYDASGNLIAGNTFDAPIADLVLQAGPTNSSVLTGTAGGNTIWGNLVGGGDMGIVEVESNDLIYNNRFLTPYTACQPGDPALPNYCWVTAYPNESFNNTWNISVQPASTVHFASGFPYLPLTGSILATSWQGGNAWWNYGLYPNSYGVLPYDENVSVGFGAHAAFITPGGDYAPLTRSVLFTVTFVTSHLPEGSSWGAFITDPAGTLNAFNTSLTNRTVELPNGTYAFSIVPPSGLGASPSGGTIAVDGSNLTLPVSFGFGPYLLHYQELGLPAKILEKFGWGVELNGTVQRTRSTSLNFTEVSGTYPVLMLAPGGYRTLIASGFGYGTPGDGAVNVTGASNITVVFARGATATLTLRETGLAAGAQWCAAVDGAGRCSTSSTIAYGNLTPDVYNFSVRSPLAGWTIVATENRRLVGNSTGVADLGRSSTVIVAFLHTYAVTFTESGLPTDTYWSVTVKGVTEWGLSGDPIVFHLTNGSFSYKVGKEFGYRWSGSPRPVVVDGSPTSVAVTFSPK